MKNQRIIAAARSTEEVENAAKSGVDIIFMLSPNICDIAYQAQLAHRAGKKLFIHLDLAEGIGKDEYGILYAREQGVDGIISTRSNIIKLAKKVGVYAVQRFFILDSQSVATTVETAKSSRADMIEIMPGVVSKVIQRLVNELNVPVVAGGLIENVDEIRDAVSHGASAISTGKQEFWG